MKKSLIFTFVLASFLLLKAPSFAQTDDQIKDFYHRTILHGQIRGWGYASDTSLETLIKDVETHPERITVSPWIGSLIPHFEIKRIIYERELNTMFEAPELLDAASATPRFLNGKAARKAFLVSEYQHLKLKNPPREFPRRIHRHAHSNADPGVAQNEAFMLAACARLTPTQALTCKKMVKRIIELMNPVENLTALDVTKTVMTDPRYSDGAARLALKLMNKVDSLALQDEHTSLGNLFQDTLDSFSEVGISPNEVEEMTWNLITVYSSRGMNVHRLYGYAENSTALRTLVALQTIAGSISVLDSATHTQNRLYSLPPSIKTYAHYGKPYHFWMAAYLARRMTQEFGNASAAIEASAMAEMGYQIFSTTTGRANLIDKVANAEPNSPIVGKIRIDLVFGFAGAIFGSSAALKPPQHFAIDLNEVIRPTLNPSRSKTNAFPLFFFPTRLRRYAQWVDTVKPLSLLKRVKQQTVCEDVLSPISDL